jgi:hypothetical protein
MSTLTLKYEDKIRIPQRYGQEDEEVTVATLTYECDPEAVVNHGFGETLFDHFRRFLVACGYGYGPGEWVEDEENAEREPAAEEWDESPLNPEAEETTCEEAATAEASLSQSPRQVGLTDEPITL